jgi:hypothetical protein
MIMMTNILVFRKEQETRAKRKADVYFVEDQAGRLRKGAEVLIHV